MKKLSIEDLDNILLKLKEDFKKIPVVEPIPFKKLYRVDIDNSLIYCEDYMLDVDAEKDIYTFDTYTLVHYLPNPYHYYEGYSNIRIMNDNRTFTSQGFKSNTKINITLCTNEGITNYDEVMEYRELRNAHDRVCLRVRKTKDKMIERMKKKVVEILKEERKEDIEPVQKTGGFLTLIKSWFKMWKDKV